MTILSGAGEGGFRRNKEFPLLTSETKYIGREEGADLGGKDNRHRDFTKDRVGPCGSGGNPSIFAVTWRKRPKKKGEKGGYW